MQQCMTQDAGHDIGHVMRVVKTAKQLCLAEDAQMAVVLPAAYLHDCFTYPKNHALRAQSSQKAAEVAIDFLASIDYPSEHFDAIAHAIITHSFSANIKPETLEAQIVQDADRLDALGAIGIARCLQVSTSFGAKLYNPVDPFCHERAPDDKNYTVDHFYIKLLKLVDTMNTEAATQEARQRTEYMQGFLHQLEREV
ncbi:HD domain-containing protein [Vibrio sp. SCSIO 43136]|uniref:HD domain-containing protein n=1 Tax=Vibrio sp. SCSIO 43136 TaxID=2819101 RepID=UPI002075963E|nr:HD domain-containing protein [Vibrio sp. SCSIO 43136]USD68319.1 HD domain-containing protein [Vibrio sp. SCSIO 43136]